MSKRDDNLIYEKYKIITEGVSIAEMGYGAEYTDTGGKGFRVVISNNDLASTRQRFKTTGGVDMDGTAIKTAGGFIGMGSDGSVVAHLPTDFATFTLTKSAPASTSTSNAARAPGEYDRFLGWIEKDKLPPEEQSQYPEGRPATADDYNWIGQKAFRVGAQAGAEALASGAIATKGARDKITPWLTKKLTTKTHRPDSTASAATGHGAP